MHGDGDVDAREGIVGHRRDLDAVRRLELQAVQDLVALGRQPIRPRRVEPVDDADALDG